MDNNREAFLFTFGITAGIAMFSVLNLLKDWTTGNNNAPVVDMKSSRSRKPSISRSGDKRDTVSARKALELEFNVSRDTLLRVTRQLVIEMKRGLQSDGQTLKMIPSYVIKLPKGTESGSYLALDLGGSNFRVCEVVLSPEGKSVRSRQKKFVVSDQLKVGTATALFDFFAESVELFLREVLDLNDAQCKESKLLGFCFSFPVKQTALNKGFLMTWTKGFTASGVVDNDVVGLLQTAFKKRGLNITVAALVNDTVGTLVSHAYVDPQTYAGVILGTGTNAAYVEKVANIPKWKGGHVQSGDMVINIEWGAFDEEHTVIPFTKYDKILDKASPNPGKQTYEKMISGLYLGEIVRIALLDLIKAGYIFKNISALNLLYERHKFETAYMSRIERDHSTDLSDTAALLSDIFKIVSTTLEERQLLKRVCELVGLRAARLSAAGIAALVTKMNKLDGCTIAIDGSVFEHYPHFSNRMRDALFELLGISAENIEFAQARDGSGQGAALVACLAVK